MDEITGGIPEKTITQIYGEFATGKTTLCLQMCVNASKFKKKSIFIDTEGGFSPKRLVQMGGKKVLKDVLVFEINSFEEQCNVIEEVEKMMNKSFGFLAVDSMVALYRVEESRADLSKEMAKQLLILKRIAQNYEIPLIITNQVYEFDDVVSPVGGSVLRYWSKVIIKFEKIGERRRATLIRHPFKPEGLYVDFVIGNEGVCDVEGS